MRQGEGGTRVYFIVRGGCSVWIRPDEEDIQVNLLCEGSHFGEMGVLTGGTRRQTVIADTVSKKLSWYLFPH
jgi:CRP-like cAMP-binding protein